MFSTPKVIQMAIAILVLPVGGKRCLRIVASERRPARQSEPAQSDDVQATKRCAACLPPSANLRYPTRLMIACSMVAGVHRHGETDLPAGLAWRTLPVSPTPISPR